MQSSLPVGWLAFTGRESNPLDHDERFQITFSSSLPGLILTQRSRNSKEHGFGIDALQNSNQCHHIRLSKSSGESRFDPAEIRSKLLIGQIGGMNDVTNVSNISFKQLIER